MKIIIVGCGKIGKTIIKSLVDEKHDVTAIDISPAVVDDVTNAYDVMGICGNATDYAILKEAGVGKAELFISVTASDELNMLSCFTAERLGAAHTVARIRNLENNRDNLAFMQRQLKLSMAINPEMLSAQAIYNLIKLPSATKVETFSSSRLEMIEMIIPADSQIVGMSLKEIRKKRKEKFLICTIYRNNEVSIPNGDFRLSAGDKIGLIVSDNDTHKLLDIIDPSHKQIRNTMIIGAGIIARYLTHLLEESHIDVKIVESDGKVCKSIGETLPSNAVLINGDGMSQELLLEEGISSTDSFVALTGKDELNILISFYALSQNVLKVIPKVNSNEFGSLATKLGLDSIISPRKLVADLIVKYARALQSSIGSQIETLYSLMDGMAEATEFKVLDDFEYATIPLKDLLIKPNVILAGIIRRHNSIIPNGDDILLPGDNAIVIAAGKHIYTLSDIIDN